MSGFFEEFARSRLDELGLQCDAWERQAVGVACLRVPAQFLDRKNPLSLRTTEERLCLGAKL